MVANAAQPKTASLSDIGTAAYYMVQGLKLAKASKTQGGDYEFTFLDPEGRADNLLIEYVNSEQAGFDCALRRVRKLLFDQSPSGDVLKAAVGQIKTNDVDTAAYYLLKNLWVVKLNKIERGIFEFIFDDPKDRAHSLQLDFVNSGCAEFGATFRRLKKLIRNKREPYAPAPR